MKKYIIYLLVLTALLPVLLYSSQLARLLRGEYGTYGAGAEAAHTHTHEKKRPAEADLYYEALGGQARAVYRQILSAAKEGASDVVLETQIQTGEIGGVMRALFNDHPELFWLDTAFTYSYEADGTVTEVALSYNALYAEYDDVSRQFERAVAEIAKRASLEGITAPEEKERFVHDYLIQYAEYKTDAPYSQSAYSALVLGESVCAGYARAFQAVLTEMGVPCYYCTGTADGVVHAWNIVGIDGVYYNVDVAWDDPMGNEAGILYDIYLNLSDEEMEAQRHFRDAESAAALPACVLQH